MLQVVIQVKEPIKWGLLN